MLRVKQLLYLNLIQNKNGIVFKTGKQPDFDILNAIDALLCFPLSEIQIHKRAAKPFLLTFFKNNTSGKLCRYDVCKCEIGGERILSAQLEVLNEKYRMVIIILTNKKQQKNLNISPEHCFMLREGDTFKLYKPKPAERNPNE